MIVVLGFAPGDVDLALQLLEFIAQLGGTKQHDCLLVCDAAVDWGKCTDALSLANHAFRHATIIATAEPVVGWPQGANALFLLAAEECKKRNVSWLWLEPDAVPVKRGWLVAIDKCKGDGYFGMIYPWQGGGLLVMSGIAVYPPRAFDEMGPLIRKQPHVAFDVSTATVTQPQAADTRLIHHMWGEDNLPPTFLDYKTPASPRNTLTLDSIHAQAVLFHRNKDSTLELLVRRRLGISGHGNFMVVFGFCNLDIELLKKNLHWMSWMDMPKTHDCLLSYDRTTLRDNVKIVEDMARKVFCTVQHTSYAVPTGVGFAQTFAWQHAARHMHAIYRNWLWLEPDAIPLKPDWLTILQTIYDYSHQPFVGPMVEGASHMNGCPTIYPANTPELLPRTMSHTMNAWDCECADEMKGKTKDIGHISVAVWGVKNGRLNPLEGEAPNFPKGSPLLNQIPKTAVIFHRDKFGSLIDRMMEEP
jgi:hypothetical protein